MMSSLGMATEDAFARALANHLAQNLALSIACSVSTFYETQIREYITHDCGEHKFLCSLSEN